MTIETEFKIYNIYAESGFWFANFVLKHNIATFTQVLAAAIPKLRKPLFKHCKKKELSRAKRKDRYLRAKGTYF